MNEEQLNKIGQEIFRCVKDNFPKALTWPVRSRYSHTHIHEDVVMVIYERTFTDKRSYLAPTDCIYLKLEHLDDWPNHLYIDSLCKYRNVKNCK